MKKQITCPLTGHLEQIAIEDTPLGKLVTGCSRFGEGQIGCTTECARRLDRRDRMTAQDGTERVLVLAGDSRRAPFARELADVLRADDLIVEVGDADADGLPPPQDYEVVVFVAAPRLRGSARALLDYVRDFREALEDMPAWVVTVDRDGSPKAMPLFDENHPVVASGLTEIAAAISDSIPAT
ncbi:MAG: hypothetical protein QM831_36115 [Kofleriaceae bacterium]